MRRIGRVMQIVALALLPLAIVLQLADRISLSQMLAVLVAGVCLFWIGRIIEGYAG